MDICVHICQNGHVVQSTEWITGDEFCEKCGAEMIDRCPSCKAPIRAWDYGGFIMIDTPEYDRAAYCKNCGKAYPWTRSAIEAASELIEEEEELDEVQRNKLVSSLPDIVAETPKTRIAVVRFKKALIAVGKFTADGLRQFIIDFGCEFARKQLGM